MIFLSDSLVGFERKAPHSLSDILHFPPETFNAPPVLKKHGGLRGMNKIARKRNAFFLFTSVLFFLLPFFFLFISVFFFVCVVSFCLRSFFFVCRVTLVGHRKFTANSLMFYFVRNFSRFRRQLFFHARETFEQLFSICGANFQFRGEIFS